MHTYPGIQLCWSLGGYLAEIEDQEQENHLDTFLSDGEEYWLGLNDLSQEGIFKDKVASQIVFFRYI